MYTHYGRVGAIPTERVYRLSDTSKSDPGNHRPVSLTCILCKLLKKHVCQVIEEHLQETNQLCDNQWEFWSGRSTTAALISATHDWYCALDNCDEVGAVTFIRLLIEFLIIPYL